MNKTTKRTKIINSNILNKRRGKVIDDDFYHGMDINYSSFIEKVQLEHLSQRKIILNEIVTEDIIETMFLQILKFNREDVYIPEEHRIPIEIYINSDGGNMDECLVLINLIEQSKTPIYTFALGKACSAGAFILMAGHIRFAYPYSTILIHRGGTGIGGNCGEVLDYIQYYTKKQQNLKEVVLKHTEIKDELYTKMENREWWLTANEAKELGVIDIVLDKDIEDLIQEVNEKVEAGEEVNAKEMETKDSKNRIQE